MSINEFEKELAKNIAKELPIKEVYKDGLKPVVKATGDFIGLVPRAINAALEPIQLWVLRKEYNISKTKKLLEEKLNNIPPELIITPEPHIAVPALQAISYCMDNEEIRNMYANLLSASMTSIVKNDVHPAFVEIIKQLSPDEAKIMSYLNTVKTAPVVFLKMKLPDNRGNTCSKKNVSLLAEKITAEMPEKIPELLDNLERLKLIEININEYLTADEIYKPFEEFLESIKQHNPLPENYEWFIQKGYIEETIFGETFCKVCIR